MANEGDKLQLRILATTDIHGFYMNYDYYRDQEIPQTGLISLATLIENARDEVANTLLFDNGDLLQGSPMSDYLRDFALDYEHPAFTLMNAIGYDAATIGNHEFNFGVPYLQSVLKQADFPYVNANIETETGQSFLPNTVVLDRHFKTEKGDEVLLKIGVTGILPPQITTWDKNHLDEYALDHPALITKDAVEMVQKAVKHLKEKQNVDLVIVLAHTGISLAPYSNCMENSGYYLAQIEGVDALITGHQHRRFPSDTFEEMSEVGVNCQDGTICNTPTVMAGSWARWLGVIDLTLKNDNGSWLVSDHHAHLRYINDYWNDNDAISGHYLSLMENPHKAVREIMNVPIGRSQTGFYSYLSLVQDDHCIQVVADAQSYYANKLLEEQGLIGCFPLLSAVPLFKVGSRKDDPTYFTEIPAGDLYFKDVADLYVYPNYLVVLEITGENLKEWLECCASIYHTIQPNEEPQHLINWKEYRPYNFDIIKGIDYRINPTQAPRYRPDLSLYDTNSERIVDLTYRGNPVKGSDRFYLATNSYRALVDRFPGAGSGNVVCSTMKEIPEVLLQYIEAQMMSQSEVIVSPDYNWGLDRVSLNGRKLIIETANSDAAAMIIRESSRYPLESIGEDDEKFALYQLKIVQ